MESIFTATTTYRRKLCVLMTGSGSAIMIITADLKRLMGSQFFYGLSYFYFINYLRVAKKHSEASGACEWYEEYIDLTLLNDFKGNLVIAFMKFGHVVLLGLSWGTF